MYLAYELPQRLRNALIEHYPPQFPNMIGHHVTLSVGISSTICLPKDGEIVVIGHLTDNDSIECFLVTVDGNDKHSSDRYYHITWSINRAKGRKPVDSNSIITKYKNKLSGANLTFTSIDLNHRELFSQKASARIYK